MHCCNRKIKPSGSTADKIAERTRELQIANEELQQKNQEIALSMYNKRFLTEFSERFSTHQPHFEFFKALALYIADLVQMDYAGWQISTIVQNTCI